MSKEAALIEGNAKMRWRAMYSLAADTTKRKQQVLIVVPEKAQLKNFSWATPIHAGMGMARLRSIASAVRTRQIRIVVGTHKTLWLPYASLGLVIVEQEYYPTHKSWDQYPRLPGGFAAQQLANIHRADIVYAGAIPSLSLWHNIKRGRVEIIRYAPLSVQSKIFDYSISDRRQRLLLPQSFVACQQRWITKGEFTGFLSTSQGEVIDRVRKTVTELFPRVARRIAINTTTLLKEPASFDRLVWLWPEKILRYPDIRSAERAYYLLARLVEHLPSRRQVAIVTRARRLIEDTIALRLEDFFEHELTVRHTYSYPPFRDMVRITLTDSKQHKARSRAVAVRQQIEERLAGMLSADVIVRGPWLGLRQQAGKQSSYHLLLLGSLPILTKLYRDLPVDSVELDPQWIL